MFKRDDVSGNEQKAVKIRTDEQEGGMKQTEKNRPKDLFSMLKVDTSRKYSNLIRTEKKQKQQVEPNRLDAAPVFPSAVLAFTASLALLTSGGFVAAGFVAGGFDVNVTEDLLIVTEDLLIVGLLAFSISDGIWVRERWRLGRM